MSKNQREVEKIAIWICDIICLIVSFILADLIRYGEIFEKSDFGARIFMIIIIYLLVNFIFDFDHKFFVRGVFDEAVSVFKMMVSFALGLVLVMYLNHNSSELSRLVFGYFLIISGVLVFFGRIILKKSIKKYYKSSKKTKKLLLITDSKHAESIIGDLKKDDYEHVLNGIALADCDSSETKEIAGVPVVADFSNIIDYVTHNEVDEVFIAYANYFGNEKLKEIIGQLSYMGIVVNLNIYEFDMANGYKMLGRVGNYATVTFARNMIPLRGLFLKRIMDIFGSIFGLLALAIASVFVVPAIKIDSPGPVFFRQTRVGKNGRKFTILKFRSMYIDAEERKKELMSKNEMQGLMFKMENDPRITKVGRFLRKTSLDELPQFINIFLGDMSLVGTRPPTVDEYERYEAKYKCRLSMTPGLTGMWQISGRSNITNFDEVVELDMKYIDNWTILKDIKILLQTVVVVLSGKGSK